MCIHACLRPYSCAACMGKKTGGVQFFLCARAAPPHANITPVKAALPRVLIMEDCGVGEGIQVRLERSSPHPKPPVFIYTWARLQSRKIDEHLSPFNFCRSWPRGPAESPNHVLSWVLYKHPKNMLDAVVRLHTGKKRTCKTHKLF